MRPEDEEGADAGAAGPFFGVRSPPSGSEERVPLIPQVVRHLRVHIGEESLYRGWRGALRFLDRPRDLVSDLLLEPGLPAVVPPAGMLEVLPVSGNRIPCPPRGDLRFIPVSGRIITRGMRAESVRHRLDQGGPVAFSGASGRIPGGPEDRERVHSVDADSVETVRGRFLCQGRRGRLLRDGDGDRPLIVVAEEDGR